MGSPPGTTRRRIAFVLAPVLLAAIVLAVVLDIAAFPKSRPARGSPTVVPANPHRLVTNNLKISDTLHVDLFTYPQTAVWLLASSNTGPTYIGPYATGLGPDWFILSGPLLTGGGVHLQLDFPVPYSPGLVGLEFVLQCAVVSTTSSDVVFSNPVTLRGSQSVSKNILILRQTIQTPGMTSSAQQADALAAWLQLMSNTVTVVDDVLPQSLLDFDCIFDLRFTTPPTSDEGARYVQFLRSCGGVFFVAGPYAGNPAGQQRSAWLNLFLNQTLGIVSAMISTGGNLSAATVEVIDPTVDPGFVNVPYGIGGLPFDVTNEGGNFGPPGVAQGTPWLIGNTIFGPMVFGMFFEPASMNAQTVGGRVGVLFAGGPDTFLQTATNPYPEVVMCNVAWYLDR